MRSPRPDWPARVIAAIALLFLLALALTADGQTLTPGVGLPGVPHPAFERFWCNEKRPGGCSRNAPPGFNCSNCPSAGWTGHRNENYQRSEQLLRTCWEKNIWGTKSQYTGQFTAAELEWAQVAVPTNGPLSRACWYDVHEIGGAANPIILTDLTAERYWSGLVAAAKAVGAWKPGVFAYGGYDPVLGGRVSADAILDEKGRPRRGLWPVWLDNRTTGAVEPAPEPVPDPPPPPPPVEPPPACVPYEGSKCEEQCIAGAARWGWTVERCLEVSRFCRGTCPPEPPEPEPRPHPPAECPPTAFERFCRSLGASEEQCLSLSRAIHACNPDCDSACFVPGIPSTGGMEIVKSPVVTYEVWACRSGEWTRVGRVSVAEGDAPSVRVQNDCGVRLEEVVP